MLLDQKAEQEARELAARKAEEDRAALAEAEKKKADEIAAAAAEAAAKATTEAEKKAADKAAEEAAKAAEEAAKAKADADAAIAAAAVPPPPPPPPEEKKKPIKFKDAVGRKFSFPFHLCATWEVSLSRRSQRRFARNWTVNDNACREWKILSNRRSCTSTSLDHTLQRDTTT